MVWKGDGYKKGGIIGDIIMIYDIWMVGKRRGGAV